MAKVTSARCASGVKTAPVGFEGEFTTIALVRRVTRPGSSSRSISKGPFGCLVKGVRYGFGAGEECFARVVWPTWVRDQDLVAWVEKGEERRGDGVDGAWCDDDGFGCDVAAESLAAALGDGVAVAG